MRLIVAIVIASLPIWAHAGVCGVPKEYSQLKDQARNSELSRQFLAREYCKNAKRLERDLKPKDSEECIAENSKIMQAIASMKDRTNQKWALDGCPGGYK